MKPTLQSTATPKYPTTMGRLFAIAALIEALTWAGLLTGMFLKYVTETTDLGVWLFGRLHGAAVIFYVVIAVLAAWRLRWPWWATVLAVLAAIPPLVTLPLEMWFLRRGLLTRGVFQDSSPQNPAGRAGRRGRTE
jgi:integral membrane protein